MTEKLLGWIVIWKRCFFFNIRMFKKDFIQYLIQYLNDSPIALKLQNITFKATEVIAIVGKRIKHSPNVLSAQIFPWTSVSEKNMKYISFQFPFVNLFDFL